MAPTANGGVPQHDDGEHEDYDRVSEASKVPLEVAELTSVCIGEMDPLEQRDCAREKRS